VCTPYTHVLVLIYLYIHTGNMKCGKKYIYYLFCFYFLGYMYRTTTTYHQPSYYFSFGTHISISISKRGLKELQHPIVFNSKVTTTILFMNPLKEYVFAYHEQTKMVFHRVWTIHPCMTYAPKQVL
jgi:hypothetical protein